MPGQKSKILEFIKTQTLGVVSTIGSKDGKPQSAVMAFSEADQLEVIFGTFRDTRKYENLKNNPNVSYVIGWGDVTVQYEGIAEEALGDQFELCRNIHLAKNPESKKYAFDPRQRFFKVKPTWIRYSDFSFDPEQVFEIQL